MVQTVVKVTGDKELNRKVNQITRRLKNARTPMRQVSVMLDTWVQRNFKTQGGNVGGWAPLKAGGRVLKNGDFDATAQLLQDSGDLKKSFIPFFSEKNAGIGSELPYAPTHDEGSKKVPQRRILMKASEVKDEVLKILNWFVKKVINK